MGAGSGSCVAHRPEAIDCLGAEPISRQYLVLYPVPVRAVRGGLSKAAGVFLNRSGGVVRWSTPLEVMRVARPIDPTRFSQCRRRRTVGLFRPGPSETSSTLRGQVGGPASQCSLWCAGKKAIHRRRGLRHALRTYGIFNSRQAGVALDQGGGRHSELPSPNRRCRFSRQIFR
jgi:hypothetical protein